MKKYYALLAAVLLLVVTAIAGIGAYVKYNVVEPLNMEAYRDMSILELPFACLGENFRADMKAHIQLQHTTAPTVPSTAPTTEPTTEPTTAPTTPPTVPTLTLPPEKPDGLVTVFPGAAADPSWFDNTLFIGDSRTTGLKLWYRSGDADYFCEAGMSIFNVDDKRLSDDRFTDRTLVEVLQSRQYDKIFINLGLNEAWANIDAFEQRYREFYGQIRALQPDAKIILQGIMSVGPQKAATAYHYTPGHLEAMSQRIKALADGVDTFYIDVNFFFADASGYLYEQLLAADHCHLTGYGYSLWKAWIEYVVTTLGIA